MHTFLDGPRLKNMHSSLGWLMFNITRAAAIVFFSGFLLRQYVSTTYVTGYCCVSVLYTLQGE